MNTTQSIDNGSDFCAPSGQARRTAALWVAGTGAFLLVVAAGLFVAVRWDEIPDVAKLAVVWGLTGGFLAVGHTVRPTLPATSSVVFHLGAFLIPVSLAGSNLRLGLGWGELLLVEGVICAVAFWALGAAVGSAVLYRAAAVSVVAATVGLGAVTLIPAPLALAAVAAVWSVGRAGASETKAWAAAAGFAPALAFAAVSVAPSDEVVLSLGLPAAGASWAALAAGGLAAGVLLRAAHLARDLPVAGLAFAAFATGAGTAWAAADLHRDVEILLLPAAFLLVQLAAFAARRDGFWAKPAVVLTTVGEAVSLLVAPVAVLGILLAPVADTGLLTGSGFVPNVPEGASLGLLALGWTVGALRRTDPSMPVRAGGWDLALLPAGAFALGAVVTASASSLVSAVTMVVLAAAYAVPRRRALDLAVLAAAVYAPITVWHRPAAALACGGVAAIILTLASTTELRTLRIPWGRLLGATALLPLGVGCIAVATAIGAVTAGVLFATVGFAFAFVVGERDVPLGYVLRAATLAVPLVAFSWSPEDRMVVGAVVVLLFALDTLRLADPRLVYGVSLPVHLIVIDVALVSGLPGPARGVVLAVSAVVWTGLAAVADAPWRQPLVVGALSALLAGMGLAATDPAALGVVLLVAGGLGLGAGLVARQPVLAHAGGATLTIGTWLELDTGGVAAAEAYVAPVAVHLLVAGWRLRSAARVSSWIAYGPGIAMLGGAGFLERIGGGPGWHAVGAGAVGVAAVALGGWHRLAGPLFVGTVLIVAITVFESLAVAATIPTWAWLALGGSVLLGAGVAMERADSTPVEVGRRLVDVVAERFE